MPDCHLSGEMGTLNSLKYAPLPFLLRQLEYGSIGQSPSWELGIYLEVTFYKIQVLLVSIETHQRDVWVAWCREKRELGYRRGLEERDKAVFSLFPTAANS